MEKGQSGRKLRRKAEQARDNTQHQRPVLANTFFVLNTPSALLEQALPSPSSPTAGLVGGPLALFGPSCKETQKRRQMERAASIQLTPGIPAQKLSLAHKNRFCTLNEAKAGGYGMEKDISASIQSAKTQIRLWKLSQHSSCTAGNNQSFKPLMKKKALCFHGVSSSSLNHNNSSSDHSVLIYWISHVCKSYFLVPLLPEPKRERCSPGTELALFN